MTDKPRPDGLEDPKPNHSEQSMAMAAVVLTAAMPQAFVPASAGNITHTGSGTHECPANLAVMLEPGG